ncbi:hypothetical protein [Pedobacter sp. KACC 23697]|uniref:Uncharacterized protein n=1 Tax=Pedobacter sp. KACC 23697 TaxID=3149230 RepID=A0AAU7K732_9SPHI
MLKKLTFQAIDGYEYPITVEQIKFVDNGIGRVKFKIQDIVSKGILQRVGNEWIQLEGDIKASHISPIGAVIRLNFDT